MTAQQQFNRVLADVLAADGPQAVPSSFIDASITAARATGQRRPLVGAFDRRGWPARTALGSVPSLRPTARLVLIAALVVALVTSAVAVGMKVLEQPVSPLRATPVRVRTLVPAGTLTDPAEIALALPDGRLLVDGAPEAAIAQLFDPGTGLATPIESGATSVRLVAAAPLPGGRVFLLGWQYGPDGDGGDSRAWVFDAATAAVSPSIRTIETRSGAAAAVLPDGRVLVLGGNLDLESGVTRKTTEVFDPTAMRFSPGPDLAAPRYGGLAAATADGHVLVVGGFDAAYPSEWNLRIELLDPGTGITQIVGSLAGPPGLGAFRATRQQLIALPDGRFLIFGRQIGPQLCGRHGIDPVSVQEFDPASGTLTEAAPVDHGIRAAVAIGGGHVLVAGSWNALPNGCENGAESITNHWLGVYDPAAGLVAETRDPITGASSLDLTVTHEYAGGALLPDGRVALLSYGPEAPSIDIVSFASH